MKEMITTTTPENSGIETLLLLILLFLSLYALALPANSEKPGLEFRVWGPLLWSLALLVIVPAVCLYSVIDLIRYMMPFGEILLNLIVLVMPFMVCSLVYSCYCR